MDNAPLMARLHERFDAEAARDVDEVLQLELDEGPRYFLAIHYGHLEIEEGVHDAPSVTLMASRTTLERLMNKELSGMQAVMSGKLRARGDIMLAAKMTRLFRRREER